MIVDNIHYHLKFYYCLHSIFFSKYFPLDHFHLQVYYFIQFINYDSQMLARS